MATESVIQDLYNKINANTVAVASLAAEVKTLTLQNSALIELNQSRTEAAERTFKWLATALFLLILFLSGIIGYGAIGKDGMFTVRETSPQIPWHNDLDKWQNATQTQTTTK